MNKGAIVITGASGFIGRQTVEAARARGHKVRAIMRRNRDLSQDTPEVETIVADLGKEDCADALAQALTDAKAVIHLASSLTGDEEIQARDTIAATERLLAILGRLETPPHLVLASSLSVYGYADLPKGAVIDEATSLEPHPDRRDAYCRGKLAQEALIREAGRPAWILRPGAVFGPDRLWNASLGAGFGPLAILFGGGNTIPVSWVGHAAEALVLAAETAPDGIETVNVIDDDLPDQRRYARAHARSGWPGKIVAAPLWPLALAGGVLSKIPGLANRRPGLLRREVRAARFGSFRYTNAHLKARLGWRPSVTFDEAMDRAIAQSGEVA